MWKKKGLIFDKHAQLPTPEIIGDKIRIYYSTRIEKQTHIKFFDIEGDNPTNILHESPEIIMGPGERGTFDDAGVMPSCVIKIGGRRSKPTKYMYYTGWTLKNNVPYSHAIGLMTKSPEDTYGFKKDEWTRNSGGPIMSQSHNIKFLCNSPCVVEDELRDYESKTNVGWRMYFCNGTGWDGDFPTYIISESSGPSWDSFRIGGIVGGSMHTASSRPCALKIKNRMHIYYAEKTKDTPYKINLNIRQPGGGYECHRNILPLSRNGWDSEMVCYPWVMFWKGKLYMFYNGNGYGETGIGLAVWE